MVSTQEGWDRKERLLGLSRLQLVAATEILRLLIDEHEPWPDDDKAPLTLLQETWINTQQSADILGELIEARSGGSAALEDGTK